MSCSIITLSAGLLVALPITAAGGDPAKQPKKALAGWIGLFPNLQGYQLTFQTAINDGDKKSPKYRQAVAYEWMGGADRHFAVTISRDAAFKQTYREEEIKKSKPAPQKTEVDKHAAWLWKFEPKDKKTGPLLARLVVLLGDDRVMMVEQKGLGPFTETVQTVAGKFDLKKLKEALDKPPDTSSRRTVETFRQLQKGMSYAEVSHWVGYAEKDIGSGIHIMRYTLDDGSEVLLGFPDFNKLMYVKHKGKDGKTVDLVK